MSTSLLEQSLLGGEDVPKKSEWTEDNLSNERIVWITAAMFFVFVVAEIIGAFASNSLFLLGDAAAMSVDVVSYGCSIWGERVKAKFGSIDLSTRFWIDVYIPGFSIVALLAVSAYITVEAIDRVKDDSEGDDDDDDVDVTFLYIFAGANLFIDIVSCVLMCIRRDTAFTEGRGRLDSIRQVITPSKDHYDKVGPLDDQSPGLLNLNMLSVLAHTGGDTLRTLAALAAAITATTTNKSGSLCDAWACIVVTITIVVAVIPLCSEIYKAYNGLLNESLQYL